MTPLVASLILVVLICLLLGTGVWIYSGIILLGLISLWGMLGFSLDRVGVIAVKVVSSSAVSWELAAVPMFIFMGDIIFRTDISKRLFAGLAPIVRYVPGGLLHTNILGCTIFAAVCGSGTATTATVGKITIGELLRRGYSVNLVSGSLAGAGTFGLMIPPSIAMIIYGVLANVSIAKLFAAGILPGIMLAVLYSGYIAIYALVNPSVAPKETSPGGLWPIISGLRQLVPFILLMGIVLGSIYTGIATPSEAAAVGVAGALLITVLTGQFSVRIVTEALSSAVRISATIGALVVASAFLSAAITYLRIPAALTSLIASLELTPLLLLAVLGAFYIVLGTFLDGSSMTVMTVPIVLPMVVAAGYDPIWFGIYLVIMIELSALTPPVGLNINILQGLTGQTFEGTVSATIPFFLLLCLGAALLAVFPDIALWLPNQMSAK
jgi:tripartite ATP-independent transporter DctM subunit